MILSIDIGGTYIKYGLVDSTGNLSCFGKIQTPQKSYEELIKEILIIHKKFDKKNIKGISISAPGTIEDNGLSSGISAIPYILNKNIKTDINLETGLKVIIENDANCTIISEKWKNDVKNSVAISIGTGIGGSLIMNGELIKGSNNSSGEFGLVSNFNSENELQTMSLSTKQISKIHNLKYGTNMSPELIFSSKDKNCIETVNTFYKKLVILSINLEYILNPELIIFSGGITNDESFLEKFKIMRKNIINENTMTKTKVEYKVSEYKSKANLLGSAYIWYK